MEDDEIVKLSKKATERAEKTWQKFGDGLEPETQYAIDELKLMITRDVVDEDILEDVEDVEILEMAYLFRTIDYLEDELVNERKMSGMYR